MRLDNREFDSFLYGDPFEELDKLGVAYFLVRARDGGPDHVNGRLGKLVLIEQLAVFAELGLGRPLMKERVLRAGEKSTYAWPTSGRLSYTHR